jgi:putative ABC transport system ATP-binding protein
VSLRLRRGEFAAIMGPSGSRESTLPHLLGGRQRSSSGEIWLDGCRVHGLSQADWAVLRRRRIGGNRR